MIYYSNIPSPIGMLTAVCENACLTGLYLLPEELPSGAVRKSDEPVLLRTKNWLNNYFHGSTETPDIPMKPKGTEFQMSVWAILKEIPYGTSVTYGTIAGQLANPKMSAQAVGQAVGKNPINILNPCHRVLGTGGKLTGYAYGLDKKRYLLDLEGIKYK